MKKKNQIQCHSSTIRICYKYADHKRGNVSVQLYLPLLLDKVESEQNPRNCSQNEGISYRYLPFSRTGAGEFKFRANHTR